MKKHTTFQTLLQKYLIQTELQSILKEFQYVETARKYTVFYVALYNSQFAEKPAM